MHLWIEVLRRAVPLIFTGDPYMLSIIWFTVQVALIATAAATVIGVPIGLGLGLGRFRGRGTLQALANASMALPPVLVGLVLFFLFVPQGLFATAAPDDHPQSRVRRPDRPRAPLHRRADRRRHPRPPAKPAHPSQAAGRRPTPSRHPRPARARIGVIAAIIASLGTSLSEVGAMIIVGGNVYGYDQTLASSTLYNANAAHYDQAIAAAIVLTVLIIILMCTLGLLQQHRDGLGLRFRTAH